MADAFMHAEIARVRHESAERAAYIASADFENAESSAMRRELDTLTQACEEKLPKAFCVEFYAHKNTPQRAFALFQAHLVATSYTVNVKKVVEWADFGCRSESYKVTVARSFT